MRFFLFLYLTLLFSSCSSKSQSTAAEKTKKETTEVLPAHMRPLNQLLKTDDSAWPYVQDLKNSAKNKVELLPKTQSKAEKTLFETQVTTASPMGAIIYETGGILIDGGWIRILGSGSAGLNRSITDWNKGKSFKNIGEQPSYFLVADDVLGGFFAINAGGISSEEIGSVFYLAPDSRQWESLGGTYSNFLEFCFMGDLNQFYEGFRWKNWQEDLKKVSGKQGFSFFPFLFTAEAADIEKVSKKVVPIEELWIFINE